MNVIFHCYVKRLPDLLLPVFSPLQDRVTDHRTGYTTMNLDSVLDGEGLEAVIEACRRRHEEEVMAGLLEE